MKIKKLTKEQQEQLDQACRLLTDVIVSSYEDNLEQRLLDFANYCIGEGFTSNATESDLKKYLENAK